MTGTIGGGCVEAEVWNAAREVIETEKPKHLTFNLGQDARMLGPSVRCRY
jgi:xanthine dehydrogenase accessory factor